MSLSMSNAAERSLKKQNDKWTVTGHEPKKVTNHVICDRVTPPNVASNLAEPVMNL